MTETRYLRCPECEGIGTGPQGEECLNCEGHGGLWMIFGPGMSIKVIPGDADDKPEAG